MADDSAEQADQQPPQTIYVTTKTEDPSPSPLHPPSMGDVDMGDDDEESGSGSEEEDDDPNNPTDPNDPNRKKKKKRRRGLPGSSCEPCRKQHRACDGNRPCDRCSRNNRGEMCKYGIAPVTTRPRRKSKNAHSSGSDGEHVSTYIPQPVSITMGTPTDMAYAAAAAYPNTQDIQMQFDPNLMQQAAITMVAQATAPTLPVQDVQPEQQVMEDEREKLHEELQTLAQVLDNLHSQLQPAPTAQKTEQGDGSGGAANPPALDPIFLRDSLWRPPAVPTLYAPAGVKPSRGKIMTLDAKDQAEDGNSTTGRGKKRKPVRKFYPRALKGTTVGYSESELANLQFAKDLLAYFGGDFNNVSVGQHAQCVVYKDFIVYVNREFIELMRSPYENIIGRSMDDFVPEAFLQYHNHMFHRELVASGSSTIAFETVMARLDRTCFKCVFGMSLMKNANGKLVQKICTIYLNTIQEVEVPPGKTPVPYFETDYSRKVEYEEMPEPCKDPNNANDESRFPLYFAKACFEAKQIRDTRLTARRNKNAAASSSSQDPAR
jgi:hypothetical protein